MGEKHVSVFESRGSREDAEAMISEAARDFVKHHEGELKRAMFLTPQCDEESFLLGAAVGVGLTIAAVGVGELQITCEKRQKKTGNSLDVDRG